MYAFAHPLEDAIEGVTHSLCTLEFDVNVRSMTGLLPSVRCKRTTQYEFGRLNLTNMVISKRKLKQLVDEKLVDGWDDPYANDFGFAKTWIYT